MSRDESAIVMVPASPHSPIMHSIGGVGVGAAVRRLSAVSCLPSSFANSWSGSAFAPRLWLELPKREIEFCHWLMEPLVAEECAARLSRSLVTADLTLRLVGWR